jgi:Na+/melibiose symporter-like transporter
MVANFAGPAMAWIFFFGAKGDAQATTVEANYHHMGGTFAIATAVLVILVVVFTFRWHEDTRSVRWSRQHGRLQNFFREMKTIFGDPNSRWVLAFIFVVSVGMVIVGSLQMFVYDDFMKFTAGQKSIAHGSTMVAMALGALVSMGLTGRFDKKGAVFIGGAISIAGNIMLAVLFLTGIVPPDATIVLGGATVPLALPLFVLFHSGYWFGNGIMLPVSTAMIADVSEVRHLQTGEVKDGGYSSVFSLAMRLAISFGLIASGWFLSGIGYQVPKDGRIVTQTPHSVWSLGMVTFVIGAVICLASLLAIRLYPITRRRLEELRAK